MDKAIEILPAHTLLLDDIRQIINQARNRVAVNVNSELTLMYWHIGERINRELLDNKRAAYGKQIVATVARQLQEEYGEKGFDEKKHQKNDAVCKAVSRYSNCRTAGTTIIMDSFLACYADKRSSRQRILFDNGG